MKVSLDPRLPELLLFEPQVFRDQRGEFREMYSEERYVAAGLRVRFVQDNLSRSKRNVLRGLHLQHPRGQGKLVSVLDGVVFDVAVDVRRGSPTFGRWAGFTLSAENAHQLWIPSGFLHGFVALSDGARFHYRCTDVYSPTHELSVRWDDPALGIQWPVAAPLLCDRDAAAPSLAEVPERRLPVYAPDVAKLSGAQPQ